MLIVINMKKRPYVLKARGDAKQATHQRILEAGAALMWEKATPEIVLDDVADRAGVTVQTLLRHFGTREGLLTAVEEFVRQAIVAERQTPPGDVSQAITVLFDHYEHRGDIVLRLLAQEFWNERIHAAMDLGRHTHREWVEQVFAAHLQSRSAAEREAFTDLLVVATDVYTWKLLRRDRTLERQVAEDRVAQLIAAILAGTRENEPVERASQ